MSAPTIPPERPGFINGSQYALTDSAYDFLSMMKSNSEQLGSIFDPLPGQVTGNIHSLSNPAEPVIGYVSAGTLQQQRIFINRFQIPTWLYAYGCPIPDRVIPTILDSMILYFDYLGYVPIDRPGDNTVQVGFGQCVDCRTQGGTTTVPPFWP
jgi:Domain of unknown function (DUF4249)